MGGIWFTIDGTMRESKRDAVIIDVKDVTARCTVSTNRTEPGEAITLDASASEYANLIQFDTDRDDDFDTSPSTDFTLGVTYNSTGIYRPRARATGERGTPDEGGCGLVEVGDVVYPTSDFAIEPASGPFRVGDKIELDANVTTGGVEITRYTWRIDGRIVGAGPTIEHRLEELGNLSVELEVVNAHRAGDSSETTIRVESPTPTPPPTPSETPSPIPRPTESTTPNGTSNGPISGVSATAMSFGIGAIAAFGGVIVYHRYEGSFMDAS